MDLWPPDGKLGRCQGSNEGGLRISRWSVYQLIWSGQLRTLKIGRRRLTRPAAYAACVNQLDNKAA